MYSRRHTSGPDEEVIGPLDTWWLPVCSREDQPLPAADNERLTWVSPAAASGVPRVGQRSTAMMFGLLSNDRERTAVFGTPRPPAIPAGQLRVR
jgi:hypothetical protein